jgi:hypothetical protein
MTLVLAAALLAALHAPRAHARELVLRPLVAHEAREHRLPFTLLAAVIEQESTWRYWKRGDHGAALGLGQLHYDCIPGRVLSRRERVDVGTGVHFMAVRLELARRRCGGGPARYADNYNGARCGRDVYHLGRIASR